MSRAARSATVGRLLAFGLLAVLGCGTVACGVPVSSAPQVVSAVPDGLLTAPDTPRTSNSHVQPKDPFDIFLVAPSVPGGEGQHLIGVVRSGTPTGPTVDDLLATLDAGPSPFETGEGISSELPQDAQASIVRVKGDEVTVNLNANFGDLSPLGIAQIVYTLTQVKGITEVLFFQFGGLVDAPNEDGQFVPGPFTQHDFSGDGPKIPGSTGAGPTGPAPPKCSTSSTNGSCRT